MNPVAERFIRYCKIDTQSDEGSESCPSTAKQLDLARLLRNEMETMGITDVDLDNNGYLTGSLPKNTDKRLPVVGFIAHMDTSPDMSGTKVNPQIIKIYDGENIILNKRDNVILPIADFPELLNYKGHDLITTDGTTLLGADDKAGIAEILSAVEFFIKNPEAEHGEIRIGFTPDEEIGRGADKFDVKSFGADFAFTVDGGQPGELEFENFNAALATINIQGRNVHPGTAKNQMVNSMHLACEFNSRLPEDQKPEHTEGYEGFFHLVDIEGTVEKTVLRYLIRDHNKDKFISKKKIIESIASEINSRFDTERINVEIKEQYSNMREKVEPHYHIIELAEASMKEAGVKPIIKPIRGGTDGARLSFLGLPCPNIFTGGHNFHGRYEYISINARESAVETIKKIIINIPKTYQKK